MYVLKGCYGLNSGMVWVRVDKTACYTQQIHWAEQHGKPNFLWTKQHGVGPYRLHHVMPSQFLQQMTCFQFLQLVWERENSHLPSQITWKKHCKSDKNISQCLEPFVCQFKSLIFALLAVVFPWINYSVLATGISLKYELVGHKLAHKPTDMFVLTFWFHTNKPGEFGVTLNSWGNVLSLRANAKNLLEQDMCSTTPKQKYWVPCWFLSFMLSFVAMVYIHCKPDQFQITARPKPFCQSFITMVDIYFSKCLSLSDIVK